MKFYKILYYADRLHYLSTGQPLTGAEYQKQQFGPTARYLGQTLSDLVKDGRMIIEGRMVYGCEKSDFLSLGMPDLFSAGFAQDQVALLDDVTDFGCPKTAREISEFSHAAAWESVEIGEIIPYFAAIGMFPSEVTDEDVAWAVDDAHRLSPLYET